MEDTRKNAAAMIDWIRRQQDDRYAFSETEGEAIHSIVLKTEYAQADINIYYLDFTIMEFRVTDAGGESAFYLHFELTDTERAKELFGEMKTCLLKQKADNVLHVMLCCTAGLTTSYFTMKLNDSAKAMELKMDFEAVPYERLYEKCTEKDAVLLAPQISYRLKEAQKILTDKTVLAIPAALFGTYDTLGVINFVRDSFEKAEEQKQQPDGVQTLSATNGSLLLVSVIDMEGRTQLAYRIYDNGEVTAEKQIVKETYRTADLLDVIDSVVHLNKEIETICLITPGSVHEGRLTYEKANIIALDIRSDIEEKTGKKAVVLNSADAIALGYSVKEKLEGETGFYFLPTGDICGSIGIVEDGNIFGNAGHMGGEQLMGVTDLMTFPKNPWSLARTPEGNVQLAARYLTGLIAYTGCRHIAFYAKMIPDAQELIREIGEFIKPEYIPEIVKVSSVRDYLYEGALCYMEHRKD